MNKEEIDQEMLYNELIAAANKVLELVKHESMILSEKYNENLILNLIRISEYVCAKICVAHGFMHGLSKEQMFDLHCQSFPAALNMFDVSKEKLN